MENSPTTEHGASEDRSGTMQDMSPKRKSRKSVLPDTGQESELVNAVIRAAILQQSLYDVDKDAKVIVKELETPTGKRPFLIMMSDKLTLDSTSNFVPV